MREIDALDGLCSRVCGKGHDQLVILHFSMCTIIQFRYIWNSVPSIKSTERASSLGKRSATVHLHPCNILPETCMGIYYYGS